MGSDSGEASMNVSPGPGFSKPGPDSSHDSSYVRGGNFNTKNRRLYKNLQRLTTLQLETIL